MPYGLRKEEWEAIDNRLVKKLFRTPQYERVLLLSSWSDEELWEALEALQNVRNNKQKIDLINTELTARRHDISESGRRKRILRKMDRNAALIRKRGEL